MFGLVRTSQTAANYVSAASICLFSAHQYFSETSSGSLMVVTSMLSWC